MGRGLWLCVAREEAMMQRSVERGRHPSPPQELREAATSTAEKEEDEAAARWSGCACVCVLWVCL